MRVTITKESYGPSKELKGRLRSLCFIAASAKVINLPDLYQQAKEAYDSLAFQYNQQAKSNERGFFQEMWDNFCNRERYVEKIGKMEDSYEYSTEYNTASQLAKENIKLLHELLKTTIEGLQKPYKPAPWER